VPWVVRPGADGVAVRARSGRARTTWWGYRTMGRGAAPSPNPLPQGEGEDLADPALADDDLDAAVLWLAHAGAGRYEQVRLSKALDADGALWDAVAHQFARDRLGTPYG
jgi:hypothetical protein